METYCVVETVIFVAVPVLLLLLLFNFVRIRLSVTIMHHRLRLDNRNVLLVPWGNPRYLLNFTFQRAYGRLGVVVKLHDARSENNDILYIRSRFRDYDDSKDFPNDPYY